MKIRELRKSKLVLWIMFFVNFGCVLYLVWTPAASIYCSEGAPFLEKVFCLSLWLNLVGNFLLLAPTALLLVFLFPKWPHIRVYIIVTAFAFLIELSQNFVPGRNPNELDFILNSSGSILTIIFFSKIFTLSSAEEIE